MSLENNLGFGSREELDDIMRAIIGIEEHTVSPYNETKNMEIVSINPINTFHENSNMYALAARVNLGETRPLMDFTIKEYKKNFEKYGEEKWLFTVSNELIGEQEYPSTRGRKIRFMPKNLSGAYADLLEKKNLFVTESLPELNLWDMAFEKEIFWDKISPALDSAMVLMDYVAYKLNKDYLPYKLKKETDNISVGESNFKELNEEYTKLLKNGDHKFIMQLLDYACKNHLPYDSNNMGLGQEKINLGQNNTRGVFGGELLKMPRSVYLGGFFGHPFIYSQIGDIESKVYEGYMGRRKEFERKYNDMGKYDISPEEFNTGFYLGAVCFNQDRISTLNEILPEYENNSECKEKILKEKRTLTETLPSQIDKIRTYVDEIFEIEKMQKV